MALFHIAFRLARFRNTLKKFGIMVHILEGKLNVSSELWGILICFYAFKNNLNLILKKTRFSLHLRIVIWGTIQHKYPSWISPVYIR